MMLARKARLGPYEIQAPLGHGGMGEVYRATDTRLDRTVALKVLPAAVTDHPARRQRFEREARALASLSHPHICPLYDVGEQDGVPFLVMEYLDGETLAARLGRGALPLDQVVSQAIDIADALDHAHRQGVIHRDLKPSNVMVTRSGVKVLDFGIARLCAAETIAGAPMTAGLTTQTITEAGTIVGTPQYMAPEQLEQRATDARTDIFAFGAVVYEMATGSPAFAGKSQASLIAAILTHDPPPLSVRLSQLDKREGNTASRMRTDAIPPQLDHAIAKCLAKDPDERWQNASDLRQVLKWIAESRGQVHGIRPATAVPASRPMQVARLAVGALIVSAAVALGIAIGRSQQTAIDSGVVTFEVSPPEDGSFSTSNAFLAVSARRPLARAVARNDLINGMEGSGIWIVDAARGALSQFASDGTSPLWTPDGTGLVFDQGKEGRFGFRTVRGAATEETLERGRPEPRSPAPPLSWLPAEHAFLFSARGGLWKLPLEGDRTPVLVRPRFDGRQAQLSPDSRWLAYVSVEAERPEVTVEAFPSGERKWRVSVDGGLEPQWRRDGRELYFLAPDKALMSVAVKTDSTFEAKLPERLFDTRIATNVNYADRNQYVVSADGQRFLINQVTGQPTPITVVVNWPALLKK